MIPALLIALSLATSQAPVNKTGCSITIGDGKDIDGRPWMQVRFIDKTGHVFKLQATHDVNPDKAWRECKKFTSAQNRRQRRDDRHATRRDR